MSIYLNAILMLAAVLGGILVLARVVQAGRGRRLLPMRRQGILGGLAGGPPAPRRLAVEETVAVDARRRLLLVRCEGQRIVLMTGGPADLVVSVLPAAAEAGA